ncbi:MAG: N-6 DNA methylase [Synergistaceae bacterium]|nr:N-6 DNA methylase [Synergistaceae bacterium]
MKNFIERWKNKGDEKSDTQKFWLEFLHDVLGVENPSPVIEFEKRVKIEHKNFIDAYLPSTRVLIEQKSFDVDLDKPAKQSDDEILTPFEQAKRYSDWLPDSEHARWIITCNFQEFHVHDMDSFDLNAPPEIIRLENLEEEARKFQILIEPKAINPKEIREEKISIEGGKLVKKLKESLKPRYRHFDDEEILKRQHRDLTIFCVRIVFLLYAEDSGLLKKNQFYDYLKPREIWARCALIKLFDVLRTKEEERDFYLENDLRKFPYVDGGLFADKNVEIPLLDGEPIKIILDDMSQGFDWSGINPPIFGAIFERVLDDSERETGGMHYTTVENIHKVIDPLFLDELNAELENIFAIPNNRTRTQSLIKFQNKLGSLKFLDPACGSGNFLTESFKSLRKLENRILSELSKQKDLKEKLEIKVSISQFYGIEVNDFAVAIARTALWIVDNQMWKETQEIRKEDPLPLKEYDNIKEGSAMDNLEGLAWGLPGWKINHDDMLYIMGNPPFLGYSQQNPGQKEDVRKLLGSGKVDYVACWFAIASEYLQDKKTKAAFVATNSITQGEQVAAIFKPLHERWGIEIDFAHQSFVWDSELRDIMAHVHCVVIGFSTNPPKLRKLYTPEGLKLVENINFYLKPAPNFFIEARREPICPDAPFMRRGSQPTDGGNLILTLEEKNELLKKNPQAEKFIRPFMMGVDFIHRKPRYCLWLVNANPDDIKKSPLVMKRIKAVKIFRLASKKEATKRKAETPTRFDEIVEMTSNYIAIPEVSGERQYIPIDWLNVSVIPGNKLRIIPNVTLYHFGVLTSHVHMAWMRFVGGRLGMSYDYSIKIVYNNFMWPSVNEKQRAKIETTAKKILDARALYPESSFASLYNDELMPAELRKAHKENDAAVCEAYGWDKNISEEEIVIELMKMYGNMIK